MDDILNFVANMGFPIGVSCYLLVRLEQKLDCLTESISELGRLIERNGKV